VEFFIFRPYKAENIFKFTKLYELQNENTPRAENEVKLVLLHFHTSDFGIVLFYIIRLYLVVTHGDECVIEVEVSEHEIIGEIPERIREIFSDGGIGITV